MLTCINAQIAPLNSPYYQNGPYNVLLESDFNPDPDIYSYRPAQAQGPFPVFIFQPGANPLFGNTYIDYSSYAIYLEHLASYGFIVLVIDDATAGFPNGSAFTTAYNWYLQKLADPNHWMSQIADSNNVVVGGHSLGGVKASDFLQNNKNNIQGIVYFASYPSQGVAGIAAHNIDDYEGYMLSIAGQEDVQSTPADCYEGYESYDQAECRYWILLDSLAHGGFGDYNNPDQPVGSMGRQKATASIRHYLISFMEYAFKGNETAGEYLNRSNQQIINTKEFETNCLYISGTDTVCVGDTSNYEIGYDAGNFYCWQINRGRILTDNGTSVQVLWDSSGLSELSVTECTRVEYTGTKQIAVRSYPVATFTYNSNDGLFQFQSAAVSGNDYFWNFGDSSTAFNPAPLHQYADTGAYIVKLMVSNNFCTARFTDTVASDLCPEANFNYAVENGQIQFENLSSFYKQLFWNLGNGDTSTGSSPQPFFEEDSTYEVSLIAINDFCRDTFVQQVNIGSCPLADFDVSVNGLTANFTNQSEDNQLSVWSIDGSEVSFNENLNYTFPDSGTYEILLTVYSANNCQDTLLQTLTVAPVEVEEPLDTISTGIRTTSTTELKIYPNPVQTALRLELPKGLGENVQVQVYSSTGRLIYQEVFEERIESTNWPAGIYILNISSEDKILNKRFVKY